MSLCVCCGGCVCCVSLCERLCEVVVVWIVEGCVFSSFVVL